MNKTTLICLVDKQYPPDHSFVTGMLSQALPDDGEVRVQLLVMVPNGGSMPPARYHRAACLPMIPDFSRRGKSRLRAIHAVRSLTSELIDKARRRDERVVLFVRNHPMLMLVAASLRYRVDRFVFQSSFPLELQGKNHVGRFVYRSMLRIGGFGTDGIIAVSPLGLERAKKLCSASAKGLVVPLLSDLPQAVTAKEEIWGGACGAVRFVYTGTHAARRRLDIVLEGVVAALDASVNATFLFIGGKPSEIETLRSTFGVKKWEQEGSIKFIEHIPRPTLPNYLKGADVGMTLIPELPQYREASPTKLAEYMGAGLAVLASKGVELQEAFMQRSQAGVLVHFSSIDITEGIQRLSVDHDFLKACKVNARLFAKDNLQYSSYVSEVKRLLKGAGA